MYKKEINVGDKLQIQCYKHNGNVHRSWDEAVLLDENDEYMVFGNNKTNVTKAEGVSWKTKEPAIIYFFKNKWYNIIAQLKNDGIYYYCNIASPFIIEEDTIKYIDYDLDLRVFPSGQYKILDRLEYNYHKKIMNYSSDLDNIIVNSLSELINDYENKTIMFSKELNYYYYSIYKNLKK